MDAPSGPEDPAPKEERLTGAGGLPREPAELRGDGCPYEMLVFAPPAPRGALPLLLYLHGAGEMGGTLREILSEGATGTPPVELSKGTALPALARGFVVVAPHSRGGWQAEAVARLLDFLLSDNAGLDLDPGRLYVTGHSMGGSGALSAGTTRRFHAVAPVAAAGTPRPDALEGVPVWAFHGRNDVVVPSDYSERLVSALRRAGASERDARLTLYDEAPAPPGWPQCGGHASTIPAYATEELYEWLLSYKAIGSTE